MSLYGFVSVSAVSVCDEGLQCFECFDLLTALQRKVCVCVAGQLLNVDIIDCFFRLTIQPIKCQEIMMNARYKFPKTQR